MSHLKMHHSAVRCSSLTAGALLAVFLFGATPANANIWSGPINAIVSLAPSGTSIYSMVITNGTNTYSWNLQLQTEGQFGTAALFTPMVEKTGVAATLASPLTAKRFNFESPIGQSNSFSIYPTAGSSNNGLLLHNYQSGAGHFPASSPSQVYAGFSFGGVTGTDFFGWVGLVMQGPSQFTVTDYAYNNGTIAAGMIVPGPSGVPEIDPMSIGSVVSVVVGALALREGIALKRRRRG